LKPGEITYAEFVEKYKKTSTPVVIDGWLNQYPAMGAWNLTRLARECGNQHVSSIERRAAVLRMIMDIVAGSKIAEWALNKYLGNRYGTTLSHELEKALTKVDLKTYIERIQAEHLSSVVYQSVLDYIASSVTVNDFPVAELCPAFARELGLPEWVMRETTAFFDPVIEDPRLKPTIFIEPDGGRAYPAHQHGSDLSHNFQVILDGAKKVVFWPYSERGNLYKSSLTSENHDEIYLAEGVHRRFDLFPAMRDTVALETTIGRGDLLYIPCKGIHVFESEGPSLGVRFSNMDYMSVECGWDLQDLNSTSQASSFVDYLSILPTVSTPANGKPLNSLSELISDIKSNGYGVNNGEARNPKISLEHCAKSEMEQSKQRSGKAAARAKLAVLALESLQLKNAQEGNSKVR